MLQVRSKRQVPVRVMLLDDEVFNDSIDKRAIGWVLFERVCESLNIIETDYFGLTYIDPTGLKFWLNNDKKIVKQMKGMNWDFKFEIKFYPPDPSQLTEDLTRYQVCLQIRRDMVNEKLPCSFVTYTLLGSYTAQSELGDFDTEEFGHGTSYLKDIKFAPHQDRELLQKIAELHRQHKGQTPEEAELHFLENAKKLAMYGVELHNAQDAEGEKIKLGVCASGLIVYKDKVQMNRFVWPKVLKISYRRKKYYIKIRPGEFEEFASLIGFRLDSITLAKRLWKISIEHHSFFRFRETEPTKKVGLIPRFGSRFRYSGRTQFQSRQAVLEADREAPQFDRVLSKRGTFSARTTTQRQKDEEKTQRRDMRERERQRRERLEPSEPTKPPPMAPKPKPLPRGPPSVEDDLSEKGHPDSINDSFEDVPDRRSKIERIHGVPTPLSAVLQMSMEKSDHKSDHEEDSNSHGPPGYMTDDPEDRRHQHPDELDLPPIGSEEIDQHVTPVDEHPMTAKERKMMQKQDKERQKREKEEAKRRQKEEQLEKKRLEKERKALLAQEKKAAKQKSKHKGQPEPDVRERRDSKNSNDIGRDWDEARAHDDRGNVTPERTRKRFSSFEDVKNEVDKESNKDRPPTPPKPLPVKKEGGDSRSVSGSSDFNSADEADEKGHVDHDEHDQEEVSF